MKNTLTEKLKRDSVFVLYDMVSSFQAEALTDANLANSKSKRRKDIPGLRSLEELTSYYRDLGLEKPDQYAKFDILRFALLATLGKKYPEFKNMDVPTKVEIFKSAKKPLKVTDISRRKAIMQRVLERRSH